ncbi:Uncharacterized protein MLTONO_0384 [Mesorhizobium loti]|nr:Uncharacterized protein MLTONO_0384 [Mesorhizobium loti]
MTKQLIQAQLRKDAGLRAEADALVASAEAENGGVLTAEQDARFEQIGVELTAGRAEVERLVAGLPDDRLAGGAALSGMAKDIFAKRAAARRGGGATATEGAAQQADDARDFSTMSAGIFAARAARRHQSAA